MFICPPNSVGWIGVPHGPTTEAFLAWISPHGCQGHAPSSFPQFQSPKRAAGSDEFMLPLSIENLNPDVASRNVRPRPSVNPTMRDMSPPPGLSGFESPRERNIVDRLDLHPSPIPSKRSRSNSTGSHRARGMDRETAHRGNPSTRDSGRGRSGDPSVDHW